MSDKTSDTSTNTSTVQLLPCPFCGGEARLKEYTEPIKISWIKCNDCGVESLPFDTIEKAITAWNTRNPMERIVERLESEFNKHRDAKKTHLGSDENDLGLRHLGKANAFSKAIEFVKEELS